MSQLKKNLDSIFNFLMRPVDASTLGAFRIVFGILLVWATSKYFLHDRIKRFYLDRDFHFKFHFFEWVTPWPGDGMVVNFAVVGIAALFIALGLFYRLAAVTFFLSYLYIFLIDRVQYQNHFYFICLLGFLFCFAHADRWMSLDNLWKRKFLSRPVPVTVPYWNVLLMKAQVFIVYFYGGIAKISGDWLRGEPMRGKLDNWVIFHPGSADFLAHDLMPYFFSYGGLFFDLSIGFMLIWRKTRLIAVGLLLSFHLFNKWFYDLGMFPFMMIAATVLFLEPDTPRKFLEKIFPKLKKDAAESGERKARFPRLAAAFVIAYLALQILIPFRHLLYPGNVSWTEEGHDFPWRMKLVNKRGYALFQVTNPDTGETWTSDPKDHLDRGQYELLPMFPRMIAQYARYLEKRLQKEGGVANPIIRARTSLSLNFRPEYTFIDPEVNLLEVDPSPFYHAEWILPLKE